MSHTYAGETDQVINLMERQKFEREMQHCSNIAVRKMRPIKQGNWLLAIGDKQIETFIAEVYHGVECTAPTLSNNNNAHVENMRKVVMLQNKELNDNQKELLEEYKAEASKSKACYEEAKPLLNKANAYKNNVEAEKRRRGEEKKRRRGEEENLVSKELISKPVFLVIPWVRTGCGISDQRFAGKTHSLLKHKTFYDMCFTVLNACIEPNVIYETIVSFVGGKNRPGLG